MKTRSKMLSIVAVLALPACQSTTSAPPDAAIHDDAATACTAGSIEGDLEGAFPRMGPGVDPVTGELAEPGPEGYVVSSTWGVELDDPAARERFQEHMNAIIPELLGNPGLVALELGSSESCRSGRTLAVWRDLGSMYAFVGSAPHSAAIAEVGELTQPGFVVTHWTASTAAEASWESAAEHLAAAQR